MQNYLLSNLILGSLFGSIIAAVSYRLKFLTVSGSVSAALLAVVIFGFGGWQWTLPILSFFIVSSLLSKLRAKKNKTVDIQFEKTGTRDYLQVISNGGLGGVLVILQYYFNSDSYFIIYAACIASVCADTWGTEIGTMYKTRTYNILNLSVVEQGSSGAISIPGTIGSFAGSLFIALISVLWISFDLITYFLIIFFSGIAGSIIDSILGAAVQGIYECQVCGSVTEKKTHCLSEARLIKGFTWINNDLVNFLAGAGGGFFSIIIMYIFC